MKLNSRRQTVAIAVIGFLFGATGARAALPYLEPCGAYWRHVPQDYTWWIPAHIPDTPRPYRTALSQKTNAWKNATCANSVGASGSGNLRETALFFGQTGWLGNFVVNERTGCHFTKAIVELNRTHLEMNPAQETYETACHENGHALGLNEYGNNTTSCMGSGGTITATNVSEVGDIYVGHGHGCN